jgi:hypothetical protein
MAWSTPRYGAPARTGARRPVPEASGAYGMANAANSRTPITSESMGAAVQHNRAGSGTYFA